MKYNSQDI